MKKAYLLLFAMLGFAGCGTPDPTSYTAPSKNQAQINDYQDNDQRAVSESETGTRWKRVGTHEVEQRD